MLDLIYGLKSLDAEFKSLTEIICIGAFTSIVCEDAKTRKAYVIETLKVKDENNNDRIVGYGNKRHVTILTDTYVTVEEFFDHVELSEVYRLT